MKHKRIILLLLTLALVLILTPIAFAGAAQAGQAEVSASQPEAATFSSGRYHLTDTSVQVSSGGGYQLVGPASPELTGNGCCCTFLPCVIR